MAHATATPARKSVLALLPAGAQHADQDLLRARSFPGPVPAPHLAGDHHAADGSFRRIVGGIQTGTVQEGEQPEPFMFEMARQSLVRRISVDVFPASGPALPPAFPVALLMPCSEISPCS